MVKLKWFALPLGMLLSYLCVLFLMSSFNCETFSFRPIERNEDGSMNLVVRNDTFRRIKLVGAKTCCGTRVEFNQPFEVDGGCELVLPLVMQMDVNLLKGVLFFEGADATLRRQAFTIPAAIPGQL